MKTHVERRSFLKISSALGGGLLLGFQWSGCKQDDKLSMVAGIPSSYRDINAYLEIGDTGRVTIYNPNPEIGQNVKTAMPMIVAEELNVDWRNVDVKQAGLDTEKYTRQVAGGSQSIRQGWDSLRKAGATAKALLVKAAANRWQIDPSECTVALGVVTNNKTNESFHYGELADEASKLEAPDDVVLKETSSYTIIGNSKKNVDLEKIITGKPLFGIDFKREGMLYASVVRPPAFGQKLLSYEDSDSKKINGVQDVVRFGNKVAVLATSNWAAMKGKNALVAEWGVDTPLESTSDHDAKLFDLLNNTKEEPLRNDGDVNKAFQEADQVVERIYEAPFLPHNTLEPMNFFANVTDQRVELIGPIQTPEWTQQRVSDLLKRPKEEITIEMTRQGGGFGRRLYGDFVLEAAEISSIAKTPIFVLFTREDDMSAGTYRPSTKYKIEASIKDNQITGYRLTEAAVNSHMYGLIPHFFPAGTIENYQVNAQKFDSNITTGAWRAPYTNFLAFAEQTFFDELAEIMEVDPVQLRLDLLDKVKDTTDEKIEYSGSRMQNCIRTVVEKSDYYTAKAGVFKGLSAYYSHNTHVAEVAELVIENDVPRVKKIHCVVDCGIVINPDAATNQAKGGVIDGMGHAMFGNFKFDEGVGNHNNFNTYQLIRMADIPDVEIHFIENDLSPTGLGEPTLPPVGGAIANALYKATGKRLYKQPFVEQMDIIG